MDKIDGILYINLDYRTDRKKKLLDNLREYNIDFNKIHRISGILNKECGHLGCGMSHVKAIKYAISKKWNNVLILEDDFMFTADIDYINSSLDNIMEDNWDVLSLYNSNYLYINNDVSPPYKNIKRVARTPGAMAYIMKKHYFERLLECFENSVKKMKVQLEKHLEEHTNKLHYVFAIDQAWKSLQRNDIFYIFQPCLGKDRTKSISDNNMSIAKQRRLIEKLNSS